jgi:hypothetical protein
VSMRSSLVGTNCRWKCHLLCSIFNSDFEVIKKALSDKEEYRLLENCFNSMMTHQMNIAHSQPVNHRKKRQVSKNKLLKCLVFE